MSTTYWAVKRTTGNADGTERVDWITLWVGPSRWDAGANKTERALLPRAVAEAARVRLMAGAIGFPRKYVTKLVKVTCFDKAESRQRAEARGAVAALEAVLAKWLGMDKRTEAEARDMLTDARKRAGIREGGR